MSREDLYYDEYFEEWELSSKEMDEFENTVYNQALEDLFNKCLEENIKFYFHPIDCMREVKEQLKR